MIPLGRAWAGVTLIILLFQSFSVLSQNSAEADSLLHALRILNKEDDSTRFELLKRIAFSHPDPLQSLSYARDALQLAKDLNDKVRIARALEEVCLSQRMLGNKIESFDAAFQALQIYDSLNMQKYQAAMYIQIGGNYTLEKEYARAIEFLSKGRRIYIALQRKIATALAEINIGETYRLMNRPDSAEWYLVEALRGSDELKDIQLRGYALGNLGVVYAHNNRHQDAQRALQEAIKIMNGLGDVYSESVYTSELGIVYNKGGNTKKGIDLLQGSLTLARQHQLKEQIKDISFMLYKVFEENKEFDKALYFHLMSKTYEDSLVNVENVKAIEQMKGKYEVEKKDKEITEQRAESRQNLYERNIIFLIAAFLCVIIIISGMAYYRKKKDNDLLAQQRNQLAEREQQKNWLLGELQHRTKNNLQMISSLLSLQSRQLVGHPSYEALRDGQSRVDALAVIHQRLYQDGSQLKINLHDYLIELTEKLVYGFNKDVEIKSDIDHFEIDVDKAVPLALIVNELVTNALKHAYTTTAGAQLLIRFKKHPGDSFVLEIADNGKGMTEDEERNNNTFGSRLIRSLASQLKASVQELKVTEGCHWRIELQENGIC